jgi:hypothetical protein
MEWPWLSTPPNLLVRPFKVEQHAKRWRRFMPVAGMNSFTSAWVQEEPYSGFLVQAEGLLSLGI